MVPELDLDTTAHVSRTDLPVWTTRQRCTCGYDSASKAEQWKHQADERLQELRALRLRCVEAETARDAAVADLSHAYDTVPARFVLQLTEAEDRCVRLEEALREYARLASFTIDGKAKQIEELARVVFSEMEHGKPVAD